MILLLTSISSKLLIVTLLWSCFQPLTVQVLSSDVADPNILKQNNKAYDFTYFEQVTLPAWVKSFQLTDNGNTGLYSFEPELLGKERKVNLYGTTDILYALKITGRLNLTEEEASSWANTILSFQNKTTGLFKPEWYEDICGLQPYHATAYATAALKLLNKPLKSSPWAEEIAALNSSVLWNSTFFPYLFPTDTGVTSKGIWTSSHFLSAVPSVLLSTFQRQEGKFAPFFDWYYDWLNQYNDPETGYWVLNPKWRPPSIYGMGGAFHLYYIYQFDKKQWPRPEKVVNATLQLQHDNGLFDPGWLDISYCIDLDGIYEIIRSLALMNTTSTTSQDSDSGINWEVAEHVCKKYLNGVHLILNSTFHTEVIYRAYTHLLPGALAAIAECQLWFPQLVITQTKWTQVLDLAPYI